MMDGSYFVNTFFPNVYYFIFALSSLGRSCHVLEHIMYRFLTSGGFLDASHHLSGLKKTGFIAQGVGER